MFFLIKKNTSILVLKFNYTPHDEQTYFYTDFS